MKDAVCTAETITFIINTELNQYRIFNHHRISKRKEKHTIGIIENQFVSKISIHVMNHGLSSELSLEILGLQMGSLVYLSVYSSTLLRAFCRIIRSGNS